LHSPESLYRRNPQVVARTLGEREGGVLLHLETGAYHGINEVGFLIWQMLSESQTLHDLTTAVEAKVREVPASLEADVRAFLASAVERDLVSVADKQE
jgi:hypothetical protein